MLLLGLLCSWTPPSDQSGFPHLSTGVNPEHSQINILHTELPLGVHSVGGPNLQQWVHTVSASVWVLSHYHAGLLFSTMAPAPETA